MSCYPPNSLRASHIGWASGSTGWGLMLASPDGASAQRRGQASDKSGFLGRRESSGLTASNRNGNDKVPKCVHLCRSLSVEHKRRKRFGDVQLPAHLSS